MGLGNTTRRKLLKTSGLAVASGAAGCIGGVGGGGGGGASSPMDVTEFPPENYESTFNLWNWYDGFVKYTKNQLPKDFPDLETVNTTGYASASEWYSKLQSGQHDIDNIGSYGVFTVRCIENDLISPLPVDKFPNWEKVPKQFRQDIRNHASKDGNAYAAPWARVLNPALGYNDKVFDSPPKSWDVLWNDEYEGKITMQDSAQTAAFIGAKKTGQNFFNPSDISDIKEALIQQKPLNKTYWKEYTVGMNMFINEEVVVGTQTMGRLYDAHFNHDAPYVEYTVPKEGSNYSIGHFVIPKDAPHPVISTAFTNWALAPENAVQLFLTMGYLPPVGNLNEQLKKNDVPKKARQFVQWDDSWNLEYQKPLEPDLLEKYSQMWTEVKAA